MVMVGDRGHDRCDNSNSTADWQASWAFVRNQIASADKHNLTSIVDSYRCLPWGPPSNIGGDAQGPTNTWSRLDDNHKITLPEVKWLAKQMVDMPGAAGILITDDGTHNVIRNEPPHTFGILVPTLPRQAQDEPLQSAKIHAMILANDENRCRSRTQ
jgi:hypothetical protein